MANPRNQVFHDGLAYHGATFGYDSSIVFTQNPGSGINHSAQIGMAVALVGDRQVGLGASGGHLMGTLVAVEADGNCTVQDRGYLTKLPYPANDGTAPTVGASVVVNGLGKVIKSTTAVSDTVNKVTHVDTVNLVCDVFLGP